MKFNCLIVDDDPVMCDLLTAYCDRSGLFEIPTVATSIIEGMKELRYENYDVVFLDLNLPDGSGQDILEGLTKAIQVIMVTSDPSFAVDSYRFNVCGFLLKPFTYTDFLLMANKLSPKASDHLFVKSGTDRIKVVLKEVQFIKSESNYVSIHEADKRIMSLMRLSDLLDGQLPFYFQQVHRSYIANLNKVDKVQTNSIWIGKHEIPVSETYRKDLYAALNLDL